MSTKLISLHGMRIVVGVGGGIAAFKAVELTRELQRRGAKVRVVMTRNATRFVGPITFSGITGESTVVDLWDAGHPGEIHVELGAWAQAMVVAPATAHVLARAAAGLYDDALLATLSCAACPLFFAPAMHERMWLSPATKRAVRTLEGDGAVLIGPERGVLASGAQGLGRMTEPAAIADLMRDVLYGGSDLLDRTVVISAGPTLEDVDPVRFISNRSSGRMGFSLAQAARDRGARVVLVAGPTSVEPPTGVDLRPVRSALDMERAIDEAFPTADVIVMTAAVADYRPQQAAAHKLKKQAKQDGLTLQLVKNPDILAGLGARREGKHPVLVGFAMETDDLRAYGRKKLVEKKVDLIVANEASVAFGGEDTQAILISADEEQSLPPTTKLELAHRVLDRVVALL